MRPLSQLFKGMLFLLKRILGGARRACYLHFMGKHLGRLTLPSARLDLACNDDAASNGFAIAKGVLKLAIVIPVKPMINSLRRILAPFF